MAGTHGQQGNTGEPQDDGIDPRRYLQVVYYRRWLIVSCVAVSLLLAILHLQKAVPVFSSTVTLKYEPRSAPIVDFAELSQGGTYQEEIKTQMEVIRSPKVIRRVIDSLGLYTEGTPVAATGGSLFSQAGETFVELKNFVSRELVSFEKEALDPVVAKQQRDERRLRDKLRVAQKEGTKIIEITVVDESNNRAAKLADEFARQYILGLTEDKTHAYREANAWFTQQIEGSKTKLEEAERSLFEYQISTDVRVMQENFEIAAETLRNLNSEIQGEKKLIAAFGAESKAAQDKAMLTALVDNDPEYRKLANRVGELELERVKMAAENTQLHPDVRRLDREIEILREQMERNAVALMENSKAREGLARIRLEDLQERLNEQQALVQQIQQEMIQYRVLERDVESSRAIYASLLDQSKQIAVTGQIDASNVTILSSAKIEEYPSSPKIMQTLALFLLCGLVSGLGLVLVVDKLDRSIKDPKVIEDRLGLATLGQVPYLAGSSGFRLFGKAGRAPLITASDPKSVESEAFRVLRTALQYSSAGKPPQVLLVSSCFAQEGKSTVASNLAVSYAQRGDKVLLIDCDLKIPVIHQIFDKPRMPGMSDVLTGQLSLKEAIVDTGVAGLDFVAAGPSTPSPGDLLESQTMVDVLLQLRKEYKVIILDSAPLAGIADSLVLSRAVDGVCIVVNRGKTPIEGLVKVTSTLDQLQAPILGVIYNAKQKRAGGADAGYYAPAYQYGYGNKARSGG